MNTAMPKRIEIRIDGAAYIIMATRINMDRPSELIVDDGVWERRRPGNHVSIAIEGTVRGQSRLRQKRRRAR